MYTSFLYQHAPVLVQNIMLSVRALIRKLIREKHGNAKLLQQITAHSYNEQAINSFAAEQLQHTLANAAEKVPFYQKLNINMELGITDFPFIDKAMLKAQKEQFFSHDSNGVIVKGETSGTTGQALSIPQNLNSVLREQAFVSRYLTWAGFKKGDKRAWLRGDMVVPVATKSAPFWRYSYFENMILLSSFHLTVQSMPLYLHAMHEFGVDIIQAYPSSIVALAKYLQSTDAYYPGELKSIVTSSESLSKEHKALIEERFKCVVFDWYGLFERVAAIGSCEHGRYHIFTDYAYVELLPAGNMIDGRERAEIVGTNFNNSLYPLIRYKTGDYVVISHETSCPCGSSFPIVEQIEGRIGDYLIGEDGQKIAILNHISKGVKGVLACQFYQQQKEKIEIRVVVEPNVFDEQQKAILIHNTHERVGYSIEVQVNEVPQLEQTKAGKIRQAICTYKEHK
ncbi:phenylacetate--CoA ligase family protein [Pseudoalteromonas sp. MMG010]|uniref:phenylacetate--CoA ligase family protein n=1 Tax=Pseudoalteromonas sp. MMG010 TaxID=2822685 RepID=UPI001B39D095|nr:phenylacetate--CoA ligase family protein [Pseudoalteromonas sp. MMG010]MBQ4834141.1 phenylacetate--CoA ligase family protein [Pseudoalteromonas sp. MMG010]